MNSPRESSGQDRLPALSISAFIALGAWMVLASVWPDATGWNWISARVGGEAALLRLFLGFAWVLVALVAADVRRQRRMVGRMVGEIRTYLAEKGDRTPASGAQSKAEAAQILVKVLRTGSDHARARAREALRKLVGQDLGPNAEDWEPWIDEVRNRGS